MLLLLASAASAGDHADWNAIVSANVQGRKVSYSTIDTAALDAYLAKLAAASAPTEKNAQLAFWMNAYNALTVDLILDNPGIASIQDLDEGDPWNARSFTVAGQSVTLNHIENEILRPLGDPRIHAGVNCASKGCPPLFNEAFEATTVDEQLNRATANWIATNAYKTSKSMDEIHVSKIFEWYGDDFAAYGAARKDLPGVDGQLEQALNFIAAYGGESDVTEVGANPNATYAYLEYSWKLNAAK
ncbi:MAG: DUF547 domain-containing protein [Proteobacteria bacterium]|nr:DUF547 domain-containing protein [Pseudomonadota bacterium]MCP4917556.1 DUF547 domain-containing protein [Pseudomonadota bacterium]